MTVSIENKKKPLTNTSVWQEVKKNWGVKMAHASVSRPNFQWAEMLWWRGSAAVFKLHTTSPVGLGSSRPSQHPHDIPEAGMSPQLATWIRGWGESLAEDGVKYQPSGSYGGLGCRGWEELPDGSPGSPPPAPSPQGWAGRWLPRGAGARGGARRAPAGPGHSGTPTPSPRGGRRGAAGGARRPSPPSPPPPGGCGKGRFPENTVNMSASRVAASRRPRRGGPAEGRGGTGHRAPQPRRSGAT